MLSFCKSEGGYSPFSMEYLKKHGQVLGKRGRKLEQTWACFFSNLGGGSKEVSADKCDILLFSEKARRSFR